MANVGSIRPVERLFPFVLRAGILMIGRDTLGRNKGKLHFVLITEDISEAVRDEILVDFNITRWCSITGPPTWKSFSASRGRRHLALRNRASRNPSTPN